MKIKNITVHLGNHFFFYILFLATLIVVIFSYNRFLINKDYIIEYEGVCDSKTQECFIGCKDDECTEQYYYSNMHKYAADLYNECGKDITDCETANKCLPNDRKCSITYCDVKKDGDKCEILTEDNIQTINNN